MFAESLKRPPVFLNDAGYEAFSTRAFTLFRTKLRWKTLRYLKLVSVQCESKGNRLSIITKIL